jgi:glycyl-tRNA synthetase (class II)
MFQVKDGRRLVLPHVVESVTTLETATLIYLCDAFEEKTAMEQTREVLCFHRKLAPYKVAFAAAPSGNLLSNYSKYNLVATQQSVQKSTSHLSCILW